MATYELGRQPFGLASPAAWLRRAGHDVTCLDLSRQPFDAAEVARAHLVAFHLPMHTATRLAAPVIQHVQRINPDASLCAYGLYAPLNASHLRSLGIRHTLGGEFEADLVRIAGGSSDSRGEADARKEAGTAVAANGKVGTRRPELPHVDFITPWRDDLPPLDRYAALQRGGSHHLTGYTEASRGCRHLCRHCPVVPVYGGRFRIVPPDVVVADVETQAARGAKHITFGDPDFFNGIGHAMRVVEMVADRCPGITYDVTVKVEHLITHASRLPRLRATGCLFVTSAVESFDDVVLARLRKGHTRCDVERAVGLCRDAGLTLAPTFIAFTPWTTLETYRDLLVEIDRLDLVDQVAPIQLALRLLVTAGSGLLELDDMRRRVGSFDEARLVYPWRHDDPAVDRLADDVATIVGRRLTADRNSVYEEIRARVDAECGLPPHRPAPARQRAETPYLNEPWYC
ncbi:MAG: radical SAM protein [Acidobacteria bacterium]|nr:radical SAM protein [Acidobacteriota bacterium]